MSNSIFVTFVSFVVAPTESGGQRLEWRTNKVTGRRPKPSNSKEASPAAPVDRLVRRCRTLAPRPQSCSTTGLPGITFVSNPASRPSPTPQRASICVFLCPPVLRSPIVVQRAFTQRNSTNSKRRAYAGSPTDRQKRYPERRISAATGGRRHQSMSSTPASSAAPVHRLVIPSVASRNLTDGI